MSIDICKSWALDQIPRMKQMYGSGFGAMLKDLQPVPEFISNYRKEIISPFDGAEIEPKLRDYIVVLMPGQHINRHIDPPYTHARHLRLNWFLSVAENGGYLYIDTQRIKPEVNEVILVDPVIPHHVTTVKGNSPLIVISFGLLVKEPIKNNIGTV